MGVSFSKTIFAIYDYIDHYKRDYGDTPTVQEIGSRLKIGSRTVKKFLQKMELMGMIEIHRHRALSIRLISREPNWQALVTPEPGEKPPMRVEVYMPPARPQPTNKALRLRRSQRRSV